MSNPTHLQQLLSELRPDALPKHVAIIMDGNGRWAQLRGLPRAEGHAEGISAVHRAVEFASNIGIKYLTLYAFSTENWNRPKEEVDTLMHLIGWAIDRELPDLIKNNVRLRLVGDIQRIPDEARNSLFNSVKRTEHCSGMTLFMCLSYSGRWEILNAAQQLAKECVSGALNLENISMETFENRLGFEGAPDPDLLIRTGGDCRISNFLLWQLAYSELFFTNSLWPDFGDEEFASALSNYQNRERRFGKTSDQINSDPQ